jgi:hypothetical protein
VYIKSCNKDKVANLLYYFLVIYIVFDGLRDNLTFSIYISYFKEAFTFTLFFYIIFIRKIIFFPKNFIYIWMGLYFLFILSFLPFSIFSFEQNERFLSNSTIMYYKLIQFFMLFYIFSIYEKVTGYKYENLLQFFIKLLIVFVIITPIIYFSKPFFMVKDFEQWGRINIGYPTMDAENLVLGMVLMLFVFKQSFFKALLILTILGIGIFMQLTATGFATLGFVVSFYLFYRSKHKVNRRVIGILVILLFLIISFVIYKYGDILQTQLSLLQIKIDAIINLSSSKSLSLRAEEFNSQIVFLNDWFRNLFGIGFKIYLENQYDWFRIGTGLLGFYGYIIFLSGLIIYGFLIRKKDRNILFLSSVIFALTSYSLITLYLFPTEASFAMMIGYSLHLQRRYKLEKFSYRL